MDLQQIPGVGKSIEQDFHQMGIYKVSDLRDKNPENLYDRLCDIQHAKIDRCMLYVMRCAVYYASNEKHDEELLKWWNWKDK